jgi:hypothetical protein
MTDSATSLTWEKDRSCFNAQDGNVTYTVHPGYLDGFAARAIRRGPRGGRRKLPLGPHKTVEQAKAACERHHATGGTDADEWVRE